MRWKNILSWVVVAYILIVCYLVYTIMTAEIVTLPMDVVVTPMVGINLDTDAVHFGGVSPGGSAFRKVIVYDKGDERRYVRITAQGELAHWLTIKEPSFVLPAGTVHNVTLSIQIPQNADERPYNGTVTITYFRY